MTYVKTYEYLWNPVRTLNLASILGSPSSFAAGILGMPREWSSWNSAANTKHCSHMSHIRCQTHWQQWQWWQGQVQPCRALTLAAWSVPHVLQWHWDALGKSKKDMAFIVVEFLAGRPEAILTEFFDRVFSRKITNISNTHPGKAHLHRSSHVGHDGVYCIWNRLKVHPTDTRGLEVKPLMTSSCIASLPCRQGRRLVKNQSWQQAHIHEDMRYGQNWCLLDKWLGTWVSPFCPFAWFLKSSYMYGMVFGVFCMSPLWFWCIQQFGWSPVERTYINMLDCLIAVAQA